MNCDSFNRFILSDVVCYVCLDTVLIKVCKHMCVSYANKPLTYLLTNGPTLHVRRVMQYCQ